jgi:protein TonB
MKAKPFAIVGIVGACVALSQPACTQAGTPASPPAPETISSAKLGYLVPPMPIYPTASAKVHEEGRVVVRVLVDVDGRPVQVSLHASSGHPALDDAALSAVRDARFRPYTRGGTPERVWVVVPIKFVVKGPANPGHEDADVHPGTAIAPVAGRGVAG